ncbi:helix-turn-helix domain-containing protein [Gemmiger formicilis]|uniref:helix-turn-helix domain-containing protein n=1 Tax=Gemmiger formicilis TaxID=745368 RepID=UPI00307930EA
MMNVDFPRMGTIAQAAAESGVPAYRVRQLCKSGQVRSVQCGRKVLVNLSSLAAWMQGDSEPVQPGIHRVQL